jgi:hypothetical protein
MEVAHWLCFLITYLGKAVVAGIGWGLAFLAPSQRRASFSF